MSTALPVTAERRLPDEAATERAASELAAALVALAKRRREEGGASAPAALGLMVALAGPLGAGKSTFVRATLRALGWTGRVPSPTYTLVEQYRAGGLAVAHLDLYRLADPDEIDALGGRELLSESDVVFIEWPDRGQGWLPPPALALRLDPDGDARQLRVEGAGEAGRWLARTLVRDEGPH